MKLLLIISLLLITDVSFEQGDIGRISQKDYEKFMKRTSLSYQLNHISYRELSYNDFKGHGASAAHTTTNIDLLESEIDGKHRFYIQCYFVPSESWINVKTPEVLAHENLHFQISHSFAHKMKEAFQRLQDCDSLTKIVVRIHYNHQIDLWKKEQQDYDDQTSHGIDTAAQKSWQLRIKNEMH